MARFIHELPQLRHGGGSGGDDSSDAPTECTIRLLRVDHHEEPESPACTVDLARFAAQHAVYADASKQMLRLDSMMNALGAATVTPDTNTSHDDQNQDQDMDIDLEQAQQQQQLGRRAAVKNPLRSGAADVIVL